MADVEHPASAGARPFTFDNRLGRPPGALTRTLSHLLDGVAEVQRQVTPYAAAWTQANRVALAGDRVRWIALGDSMTQGIGARSAFDGWIGQLSRRLGDPADIVNLSQSGARVDDLLEVQLPVWRALPPAPAGELITVLVGSNDVLSPRHRSLLPESIDDLIDALPVSAILSTISSPARPAQAANERIRAAGRDGRIQLVEAGQLGPGEWRGKLAADCFHPNDAGYAMIADLFSAAVAGALSPLA